MTIPGQEGYDRGISVVNVQPLLVNSLKLYSYGSMVRHEPEISPRLSYATNIDLALSFSLVASPLLCRDLLRQKVHLGNKRGKVHSRFRPQRRYVNSLSDKFAQLYSRCDAARRYGVHSYPKGMTDPG